MFPRALTGQERQWLWTHQPEETGIKTFVEIFGMADGERPSASIWNFSPLSFKINSCNTRSSMVVGIQEQTDENVKELLKMCTRKSRKSLLTLTHLSCWLKK